MKIFYSPFTPFSDSKFQEVWNLLFYETSCETSLFLDWFLVRFLWGCSLFAWTITHVVSFVVVVVVVASRNPSLPPYVSDSKSAEEDKSQTLNYIWTSENMVPRNCSSRWIELNTSTRSKWQRRSEAKRCPTLVSWSASPSSSSIPLQLSLYLLLLHLLLHSQYSSFAYDLPLSITDSLFFFNVFTCLRSIRKSLSLSLKLTNFSMISILNQ